jgi:hypothetical protein
MILIETGAAMERRSERILVSVTPEMKRLLKEEAELHHWSLSQTIYLILKDWLEMEDDNDTLR